MVDNKGEINEKKNEIALRFVNKILENINHQPVDKLTDFVDIDRDLIIKDINNKVLEEMNEEIINNFNKRKIGYYDRAKIKHLIMSYLRGICVELGYNLHHRAKEYTIKVDGKSLRGQKFLYSIK